MPLTTCARQGKPGVRWGKSGFCYTYPPGSRSGKEAAKRAALRQAAAILKSQGRTDALDQFTVQQAIRKRTERATSGKKFKRSPRWLDPIAVENEYVRLMESIVRDWRELVLRQVVPHIPSLVQEADLLRTDSDERQDGWAENATNLINSLNVGFDKTVSDTEFRRENIGQKTNQWNDAQWQKVMRQVVGVELFQREPWLESQLASWAAENASLVTKLKDDTRQEVLEQVQRGIRSGQRAQTITKQLMDTKLPSGVFHKTLTRAKLIARDQVSKFNGELTQLRQTNLGIKKYIWRTSGDERVRSNHRSKEGKVYAWNKPPGDTGHPGNDYQCRCWAEPIFTEVEEEIKRQARPVAFVNSPMLLVKKKTAKQAAAAKKAAKSPLKKKAAAKTQGDILDNIVNDIAGTYTSSSAKKKAAGMGTTAKKNNTKKRAKPNSKTTRPQDELDPNKYKDYNKEFGSLTEKGEGIYSERAKHDRLSVTRQGGAAARDGHAALDSYQSDDFRFVNDYWRFGDDEGENTILDLSKRIDKAIDKTKSPEDLVTYRALKWERAKEAGHPLPDFRKMVGLTYEDKGYMSTSISVAQANSWGRDPKDVVLRLYLGKGKKGFYMGNRVHNEHEILLPRGTKVRILNTSELPGNRTLVEAIVE